jgi:hypothetical protein
MLKGSILKAKGCRCLIDVKEIGPDFGKNTYSRDAAQFQDRVHESHWIAYARGLVEGLGHFNAMLGSDEKEEKERVDVVGTQNNNYVLV